ncbi:MAG: HAD hydrolase-like protein [Candidatus Pelethousia sp.]|nr:HAD hydrolase-like protein [Candidatus Pelethousia sp.]
MQMKYTTILFDFDGTLLESGPCILSSMRATFKQMGLTDLASRSDEALRPLVGPPLREGFGEILKLPPERVGEAMELYHDISSTEAALALLRPYPGIPEMLRALRARGAKTALVTAKRHEVSLAHLKIAGLTELVDYVGAPGTNHACDKARLIAEAMEALGADPARTVMVGDRLYDMEAAGCTGIPSVGVLYGYGSRVELEAHGADHIVESVEQLFALLTEQEDI